MKKLKIILLFSIIFILILTIYRLNKKDIYDLNKENIKGIINEYSIDGNKLSFTIKDSKITYYFKTENEKQLFIKDISLGDEYLVYGKYDIPKNNTNFHLFNYRNYLKSKKIKYVISADEIVKINDNKNFFYKIKNNIKKKIEKSKCSNYLKLFIMGDKIDLDDNINNTYSNNGISHLFSISGMHISLLSTLILFILSKFNKNKIINKIIVSIFLIIFSFITSYSPSVVRSVLMFILIFIFNNKVKPIYIIIIVFFAMILYNPFYIYNIGFIYSFTVSFSLILFNKFLIGKNYFIKLFKVSLLSFLVGIPISINNFFQINLLSPLLNLIFVPFVSFVVFPVSLLTFIFEFLNPILTFLIVILESLSQFFDNIKFFTLTLSHIDIKGIIFYYVFIIILISKNKFKYYFVFIIFLILHSNSSYINFTDNLTVLDVGQGDSSLLSYSNNKLNVLIDTGGVISYNKEKWKKKNSEYSISKSITIPYMKSKGIKKLDYLILTHGDYDHMGEAINLVENFKVENVIFNCGEFNDLEQDLIKVLDKKKIQYYSCIKELNIDKNKLYFLNNKHYDNENDNSSVIYTELNGYKFLFMGDAGVEVEEDLIKKYNLQDIDVLKVGHHGSKTSSGKEFIDEVNPKYSIISVGKNNRYGHPNDSVLGNLNNSKIYRTDQDGSILFKIKKDKLKIETCTP